MNFKRFLALFILFHCFHSLMSQSCLPQGIFFTTQQQIDDFPINFPNCTEIEGFVNINEQTDGTITNLLGLAQIKKIGGNLEIWRNNALEDLTGLDSLKHVGGSVWITINPGLTSLAGLENLVQVDSFFQIRINNGLINLDGPENLTTVGDEFVIHNNDNLVTIQGFNKLATVGHDFAIFRNDELVSIEGFESLHSVNSHFTIIDCDKLTTIPSFNELTNAENISIIRNPSLQNIIGFEMLENVDESVAIYDNAALKSVSGFNQLVQTGQGILFRDHPMLENINGFKKVERTRGLTFQRNDKLLEIIGFDNLKKLTGWLNLDNCPLLPYLISETMDLDSIIGPIAIINNPELKSIWSIRGVDPQTIQAITITGNSKLSECDVQSICHYLDLPDHDVTIENNQVGCNTELEIQDKCGLHPPCTFLTSPLDGQSNVLVNESIHWQSVAGADGYYLSIGTKADSFDLVDFINIVGDTMYTPTINLPCFSEIFVHIEPYNFEGLAFECTLESFTTEIEAFVTDDVEVCRGSVIQLNTEDATTAEWAPEEGLDDPFSLNPIASPDSTTLYIVQLSNGNGCLVEDSVRVTVLNNPLTNAVATDETGFGFNDGILFCNPTEGLPPYTILWSTGDTTNTVDSLPPNMYTLKVTDSNLCESKDTLVIHPYECPEINVMSVITPISCFEDCDASISITEIIGGTAPYTYNWSNDATENMISDLCSGSYSLTLTDSKQCTYEDTITIVEPDKLETSITSTDETGSEYENGIAQATASGGTPPYSYLWSDGSTTSMIQSLAPGNYYLTITDTFDCQVIDSVMINKYECPEITLNSGIENASCFGFCDGNISVSLTGGTEPYEYEWNDGADGSTHFDLCAGTYNLTATDIKNCSVIDDFIINEPDEILFWVEEVVDVRVGIPGSIDLSVDDESSYSFAWTGPNGYHSTELDIDSLEIGCYQFIITQLETGCTKDTTICVEDLTYSPNVVDDRKDVWYYPNPNRGILNVYLQEQVPKDCFLEIVGMDGKVVYSQPVKSKETVLDISDLSEGVFIARIFLAGKMNFQKLILLR